MSENLYNVGDSVWVSDESCWAVVRRVRQPIGLAHYRYDITHDDKSKYDYIEEDKLYPIQEERHG